MKIALVAQVLAVLGLTAIVSSPVSACINAFGTDHNGRVFDVMGYAGDDLVLSLTDNSENSHWASEFASYRDRAIKQPSFENATNLGVSLVYKRKYVPAIQLFLKLEGIYPGRPETAANLGTALELMGYDKAALKWIRLGIRRNQDEHFGTEWLHARILEAKIASAAGQWDRNRSIVGVSFSSEVIPAVPKEMPAGNNGRPVKPWELDLALRYQLYERMKFVPPKDWVVANLLQDWATLNLAGGPIENAKVLHRLAVKYGTQESPLWERRMQHIDEILARTKDKQPTEFVCEICQPLVPPPPPAKRN